MTALIFDFGTRHVGVAVANSDTGLVTELDTVDLGGRTRSRTDFESLVSMWNPEILVIGLPLNMDGTTSPQSGRARKFASQLQKWFRKPISFADERLSTFEAMSEGASRETSHAAAARLIGETWLREHAGHKRPAPPTVQQLQQRVDSVRQRSRSACLDAHRHPGEVTLVAVSKTRTVEEVRRATVAGVTDFGENYLQEAEPKLRELAGLGLTWHFVGRVQSNKARGIARSFDWVHTVDSDKVADRLDRARSDCRGRQPLQVCIQVNVDREPRKAGVVPDDLQTLVQHAAGLKHVHLRGLMALPRPGQGSDVANSFKRVASLFEEMRETAGPHWDTLSMGMSDDYCQAIACGATSIRIGTAIFGPRP